MKFELNLLTLKSYLPGLRKACITVLIALCSIAIASAQQTKSITGKITDAKTGEPLPYVTVSVKLNNGTRKGTATDFDGLYHLSVIQSTVGDSIYATYVGYVPTKKLLPKAIAIEVDFQLSNNTKTLNEVKVTPKTYINPAWEVMANMVKHKPDNDLKKLSSYQYQSYNRLELSVTNLSEKLRKRNVIKQVMPLMDSLQKLAGDQGTPSLPIFMSETISDYYYQNNPERKTEHVKATQATGVGMEDETVISQLVGTTFLQYNFYSNYLKLANKEFISPLTDSWKTFYNYELLDEHDKIDGIEYYKIEFKPKRDHDLAFNGVMWITKDSYALSRMDCTVTPNANLNFLSKIKIQQEMTQPAGTTAWIPKLTRIVVQIGNSNQRLTGFIGQFYLSNSNYEINKTYQPDFFKESLVMDDNVKKDDSYWVKNRHDSLTVADKQVYQMINTVKNMPLVKTYANLAGMLINGYYKLGKVSLGPYPYTYSHNDLEGSVLRIGGITNTSFSNKVILGGYVAYAFQDERLKYNASVDYIFSRKPWSQVGFSFLHDLGQTGYQYENFTLNGNNVFNASILNGQLSTRGPFFQDVTKAYIQTDLKPDLRGKITVSHGTFDPLFAGFIYHSTEGTTFTNYQTSEVTTELLWRPGTHLLQSSKVNKRITIGNGGDNPSITLRYTRGIKGLGGDFNYNKFAFNIQQKPHMGILGRGEYSFSGGYIPSALPYPLLENHRFSFNTMRFLEFRSDKYISFNYTQHMEGLITNSIPLLKKLNIRTVADLNILDGTLSNQNNESYLTGVSRVNPSLESIPYVETGYGVENILKIIRIDFLYRLTHLDHVNGRGELPNRFAARLTLQFRL